MNDNFSFDIMKKSLLTLLVSFVLVFVSCEKIDDNIQGPDAPQNVQQHNTEPYFSETVELMGLIFRLSGAAEYNGCEVTSVANSADSYFASAVNHQAVRLAKQYREDGVAYDAVTGYANQLIFNEQGDIIFDPDYLEGSNGSFDRWSSKQKTDMLEAINDFYQSTNFRDWFESTNREQQQAIASFKSLCNLDYSWFDSFYGKNDKIASRIILSFMIGGHNYGISLKRLDGTFLLTPVFGSLLVVGGSVEFRGDTNLIVHEFNHPYCNPLVDANWASIFIKVRDVFSRVHELMVSQAYGDPRIMMYETLVRSCAIRYMMSHGLSDHVSHQLAFEESRGFVMVRYLVNVLEQYEQNSSEYATLTDFMPVLVDAINKFELDDSGQSGDVADPDTLPKEYVDLGIRTDSGNKLYFATRNVGETSPGGILSNIYSWGATIENGLPWRPSSGNWPGGKMLDSAHDIATIKWGEKWHTPTVDEWTMLVLQCDFERKEADASGYGVAGYFFYNRSDRSKHIFLPIAPWANELKYWTSQTGLYDGVDVAYQFTSRSGELVFSIAGIESTGFAVRPVFIE